MKDKEPTREQIKEFWEWCGWHLSEAENLYGKKILVWVRPGGKEGSGCTLSPPIDLNNLFRYAVPKLEPEVIKFVPLIDGITGGYGLGWGCHLTLKGWAKTKAVISKEYDPALALFWAIWEVIYGS